MRSSIGRAWLSSVLGTASSGGAGLLLCFLVACGASEPRSPDQSSPDQSSGSPAVNGLSGATTSIGGSSATSIGSTGGSTTSAGMGDSTTGTAGSGGTGSTSTASVSVGGASTSSMGSTTAGSAGASTLGSTGTMGSVGGASSGGSTGGGAGGSAGPVVGVPQNPVLPGYNADPQVAFFGDTFYIYPTTDGFSNWLSTSFRAFSSSDLVTWKDEGVILDLGPDVSWADDRAWAPGIAFKNGTYYFYFSANLQIGVATASSPTGPFEDALGKPLITTSQFGGQSIDPYPFIDEDGRAYLYFGSTSAGGHVVELGDDMTSLEGTPTQIVVSGYKEGSAVFKRDGVYYYMFSEGDTRSEDYDVAYATGSSPLGPFEKATVNPILRKDTALGILGTGHNSVLQLPNGDYYIVYHRFAIPDGDGMHREVCMDRLLFNQDGSIVPVVPTL